MSLSLATFSIDLPYPQFSSPDRSYSKHIQVDSDSRLWTRRRPARQSRGGVLDSECGSDPLGSSPLMLVVTQPLRLRQVPALSPLAPPLSRLPPALSGDTL